MCNRGVAWRNQFILEVINQRIFPPPKLFLNELPVNGPVDLARNIFKICWSADARKTCCDAILVTDGVLI